MAEIKKRAVVKDISLERFVSIVETYRRDHSLDQKTMCKLLGVTTHGWIKKVADKEVPVTEIPLNNLIEITGFPREYFMDLDPERPQESQEMGTLDKIDLGIGLLQQALIELKDRWHETA
jgi:hypothetical protein